MAHQAIGMIETRGLVALVEGTDAMLKAANVELAGPMTQVGNALVTSLTRMSKPSCPKDRRKNEAPWRLDGD